MNPFLQRIGLALCSGVIIVYYGEFMFWATPDREGMDVGGIFASWILYSIMAYPFLCVVSYFRVRDPWSMFLAGAFYGWFEEGIIVQTTYGTPDTPFPMSISFTALAWHAPIDIFVGWYLVRRVLSQNRPLTTIALAGGIGLFYGLWGIFWLNEPPLPMQKLLESDRKDIVLIHFAAFAFGTTALLVFAHWLYQYLRPTEFKPSKVELWIWGAVVLAYFAFVTVPAAPRALWILPPLMGLTWWGLRKNQLTEERCHAVVAFPERVQLFNYLLLFNIPLVACAIYFLALATDQHPATNLVYYYAATPLFAIVWLISVVVCGTRRKTGPRAGGHPDRLSA